MDREEAAKQVSVPAQMWPVLVQMWVSMWPVLVQMWVSMWPVLVQMWVSKEPLATPQAHIHSCTRTRRHARCLHLEGPR